MEENIAELTGQDEEDIAYMLDPDAPPDEEALERLKMRFDQGGNNGG